VILGLIRVIRSNVQILGKWAVILGLIGVIRSNVQILGKCDHQCGINFQDDHQCICGAVVLEAFVAILGISPNKMAKVHMAKVHMAKVHMAKVHMAKVHMAKKANLKKFVHFVAQR
jgi:hypothetical protein